MTLNRIRGFANVEGMAIDTSHRGLLCDGRKYMENSAWLQANRCGAVFPAPREVYFALRQPAA